MGRSELPGALSPQQQRILFARVRQRDHHRCVLCWAKTDLCVHHFWDSLDRPVLPQSQMSRSPYINTQTYDLITLCSTCHGKVHSSDWKSPLMTLLRSIIKETYQTSSLEVSQK